MDSNLMRTARAAVDPHFVWRVTAAQLLYAVANVGSTTAGPEKNYIISVLIRPGDLDTSMLALVAADAAVVAAVTVTDEVADTDAVTDEAITTAVAANWAMVSNRYPTNPLATA